MAALPRQEGGYQEWEFGWDQSAANRVGSNEWFQRALAEGNLTPQQALGGVDVNGQNYRMDPSLFARSPQWQQYRGTLTPEATVQFMQENGITDYNTMMALGFSPEHMKKIWELPGQPGAQSGVTGPLGTQLTETDRAYFEGRLRDNGVPDELVAQTLDMIALHPESAGLYVSSAIEDASGRKTTAEAEENRTRLLGELGTVREKGERFYDTEIGKASRWLADPNSIRSDPVLAQRLAQTEGMINAQLGTIQRGAAKTLSDSGLRASGKVTNPVQQAELSAADMRRGNMAGLLGEISTNKNTLQTGRLGFGQNMLSQEAGIRSGALSDVSAARMQRPDYYTPQATSLDLSQMDWSRDYMNRALGTNVGMGLLNMGTQMGGQVMSTIPQFLFRG
ncbi:MAG: hypothetical protein V1929_09160 [bacterium]